MSQNWICVSNRVNFDKAAKHNIWGVSKRFNYGWRNAEIGDNLIFYIIGEQVLTGIFKISKAPYKDSKRIFEGDIYPYRMGIKKVLLPKVPVPFSKELRNKLKCITNKKKWNFHLRRAMLSIPDEDFNTISNIMI